MTHRLALGTLLLALSAVGCSKETVDSCDVRTGGLAALIDITSTNGTSATVHVDVVVGGDESNTYAILCSSDRLTATVGTETKTLSAVDEGEYEASFSGLTDGAAFTVALEREDDDPAPASTGILPAGFALTAPASNLSRATDALTVAWDPSGQEGDFGLRFDGPCIFPESIDVAGDPGTQEVAAGALESTGGDTPEACDIEVLGRRTLVGTADPAFDAESYVRVHQQRTVSFTSNP